MADVARLAGVSLGTVSNVLANSAPVRHGTRLRVESAIAQLGYRRNRIAQSLKRQRTHVAGVVVPDVSNPFFSELLLGIESQLEPAGYAVIFGNSRQSNATQQRYLDSLVERQVDGLIVAVAADTNAAEIERIAARLPLVLVDRTLPTWAEDQVIGDDIAGMELAVQHLWQLGHTRIALINGDSLLSTARKRLEGFEASLRARDLQPVFVSHGSFTMESGLAQTSKLLQLAKRPTAICAGNDLLALAAYAAIADGDLSVPSDISIVGYDDIVYARLVSPALTTIRQPAAEIGAAAARLLLERVNGGRTERHSVTIRPELVVRASTGLASKP